MVIPLIPMILAAAGALAIWYYNLPPEEKERENKNLLKFLGDKYNVDTSALTDSEKKKLVAKHPIVSKRYLKRRVKKSQSKK